VKYANFEDSLLAVLVFLHLLFSHWCA